jgi:tetratricopeptide (TPR) repeat protein
LLSAACALLLTLVLAGGEAETPAEQSRRRTAADDFEAGLSLARQALAQAEPGSADEATARLALGEALFRAGDLDAAGEAFRRSVALDSGQAAAYLGLARVRLTVPDYRQAGLALRRAHELDPDDPRVIRRLAGLVVSREEALRLYRRYLELPPEEDGQVVENVKAWVAMLEHSAGRKLYRLEGPEGAHQVPLTRTMGVPRVKVRIGDLGPKPFLLDSGASGITVPAGVANRLDLTPVAEFTVRGISGMTETAPFVLLPSLKIGPFTFHDVPAVAMPARGNAPAVLGLSFLSQLFPALEHWRGLKLDRGGRAPEGCPAGDWRPFRYVGGLIRIEALLEGEAVHLAVDSGAARSALSRAVLRRLGIEESAGGSLTGISGLTGVAENVGRVKRKGRLEFLGREANIRGIAVLDLSALSRSAGTEIDGILGVDLLQEGIEGIDYAAGKIRAPAGP